MSDWQMKKNFGIFLSLTTELEIRLFNNICMLPHSTKDKYYKLPLSFSPSVHRTRPDSQNVHLTQMGWLDNHLIISCILFLLHCLVGSSDRKEKIRADHYCACKD